jgi:hypothetical protein
MKDEKGKKLITKWRGKTEMKVQIILIFFTNYNMRGGENLISFYHFVNGMNSFHDFIPYFVHLPIVSFIFFFLFVKIALEPVRSDGYVIGKNCRQKL